MGYILRIVVGSNGRAQTVLKCKLVKLQYLISIIFLCYHDPSSGVPHGVQKTSVTECH